MPFGMLNSGATLVQGLNKVLEGLSGVGSYIDDIVVYNDSWEEHRNLLEQVAIYILVVRSTIFKESVKQRLRHCLARGLRAFPIQFAKCN